MRSKKNVNMYAAAMLLLALGLLAAMPGAHATTVTVASSADGALTMQNLAVNPQPIVAGDNVTISFNLFNSYDNSLYDLSLQMTGDSRILNVSPLSNIIISSIGSGNYGGIGFDTIAYKLHIPSNLPTGEYTFEVVGTYRTDIANGAGSIVGISEMPVSIYVYGKPQLAVSVVSASPEQLFPGGNQTLEVKLQNTGTDTAKNVTAVFHSSNGITVGGINRFFIGDIAAGSSATEQLYVQSINTSVNGTVGIPVNITYSSNYTHDIASNQRVYINVQSGAMFSVEGVTSNLKKGGAYDPVTYTIRNTGNIAATNIAFSLVTNYPISPVDPNAFVNSIAPGQSANVTFYVGVDSHANQGSYPATIYEQWKQPNAAANQQFSGSSSYYTQIGGPSNGTTAGASGSSPGGLPSWAILAVIVVVVIALIAYRVRKGKAKAAPQHVSARAGKKQ